MKPMEGNVLLGTLSTISAGMSMYDRGPFKESPIIGFIGSEVVYLSETYEVSQIQFNSITPILSEALRRLIDKVPEGRSVFDSIAQSAPDGYNAAFKAKSKDKFPYVLLAKWTEELQFELSVIIAHAEVTRIGL